MGGWFSGSYFAGRGKMRQVIFLTAAGDCCFCVAGAAFQGLIACGGKIAFLFSIACGGKKSIACGDKWLSLMQPLAARALCGGSQLASSGGSLPSLRSCTFQLDLSMAGPFWESGFLFCLLVPRTFAVPLWFLSPCISFASSPRFSFGICTTSFSWSHFWRFVARPQFGVRASKWNPRGFFLPLFAWSHCPFSCLAVCCFSLNQRIPLVSVSLVLLCSALPAGCQAI